MTLEMLGVTLLKSLWIIVPFAIGFTFLAVVEASEEKKRKRKSK